MPTAVNQSNPSTTTRAIAPEVGRRRRLRAALVAGTATLAMAVLGSAPAQAAPGRAGNEQSQHESLHQSQLNQQPWAKAYAQRQWSIAVELLESIPEGSRTAWQWLHLARALERSSRLVEAFATYERVHDLAAERAAVPGMRDVARQAKAESSALAHRIPWAEVSLVRPLPPGALVFVDQQWLEPARLRSPYPVNPGWHTFLVESNGEVLAARRAFFEEGQTRLVPLAVFDAVLAPGLSMPGLPNPSAARPDDNAPVGGAAPRSLAWRPEGAQQRAAEHDAGSLLKATYVSLGVGALGTLVGTGFLITALNTRSQANQQGNCFSSYCDANAYAIATADADRASRNWRARASAATASYTIGLAGFVAGGVLWLLHRDSSSRATTVNIADLSLELAPRFSPHGAMLRGMF